jgi:hypothetical protein
MANCGYKFGRWLGVIWMEKRLQKTAVPGTKPVCWQCVVKKDETFL